MSAQTVSFLRQLDIFNPETFQHLCHVIGVGAIGSRVVELLARIGVPEVHAYDADIVQPHNVPTGAFYPEAVGSLKVTALGQQLAGFPQTLMTAHPEAAGEEARFPGVVFVCVDSMDVRRLLWQHCLRQQPIVPLMIEIRIGPQTGQIYTVNPLDLSHGENWEAASAYAGGFTASLPCTNQGSAPLMATVTGLAVNQLIQWHAQRDLANFITVGLEGMLSVQAFRW